MKEAFRKTRKWFSKIGFIFLAGMIIIDGVQILAQYLYVRFFDVADITPTVLLLLSSVPMYLIGMPILIKMLGHLNSETPEQKDISGMEIFTAFVMTYAMTMVTNYLGIVIGILIEKFFPGTDALSSDAVDLAMELPLSAIFIVMVVIGPFFEEYIFRKMLIDRSAKYGDAAAILLSGTLFGLMHGNLSQFMYAFAIGCFLAFIYVRCGKLYVTYLIHAGINFMGGFMPAAVNKIVPQEALNALADVTPDAADIEAQSELVMTVIKANGAAFSVYFAYLLLILSMAIGGIVLIISNRRKLKCRYLPTFIPKGKNFGLVICNPGMLICCICMIAMIILEMKGLG